MQTMIMMLAVEIRLKLADTMMSGSRPGPQERVVVVEGIFA